MLVLFSLGIALIHFDTKTFPNGLLLRHIILILFVCIASYYVYDARRKQQEAFDKLKKFLRICAWCKTVCITDPVTKEEKWISFDEYMKQEYNFESSHGICPRCFEQHSKIYSDD